MLRNSLAVFQIKELILLVFRVFFDLFFMLVFLSLREHYLILFRNGACQNIFKLFERDFLVYFLDLLLFCLLYLRRLLADLTLVQIRVLAGAALRGLHTTLRGLHTLVSFVLFIILNFIELYFRF